MNYVAEQLQWYGLFSEEYRELSSQHEFLHYPYAGVPPWVPVGLYRLLAWMGSRPRAALTKSPVITVFEPAEIQGCQAEVAATLRNLYVRVARDGLPRHRKRRGPKLVSGPYWSIVVSVNERRVYMRLCTKRRLK